MVQVAAKSLPVEYQHEIRKLIKHGSQRQKSAVQKALTVLDELPASQRRLAMNIIRRKLKNGGVDGRWLIGFLVLLRKLKVN